MEVLQIIKDDPWLNPYKEDIWHRFERFTSALKQIEEEHGSLLSYANRHHYLGLNYDKNSNAWTYREWAPEADGLSLVGDFNGWNTESHPLQSIGNGLWEIILPDSENGPILKHEQIVKVFITSKGQSKFRIPAYIRRAIQEEEESYFFKGQIWQPKEQFEWTDDTFNFNIETSPLIYECHVGMAQEKEGVGTYREFADIILPRIHKLGYNCIQMMAVQEHPYYGSFGYHVSSFFAPTSRFGTAEDLKYLINKAHQLNIAVVMDIVHSHAVKNIEDGLNDFDGSGHQYFHAGDRGHHPAWDSKIFDYGKEEVKQFLLSNLQYWMTEFHIDGFRFDGVTSMLYHHHGHFVSFDHYDKYFRDGVETDAILYLQLAVKLIKTINPNALIIAEDMSGMPGLCRPLEEGGMGFDYRLGMGIPDYWIKLLKHTPDENWNIYEIWETLNRRRWKEKTIAYAESHDQAMVGDKTLAFWLMDKEMYDHMLKPDKSLIIERGIALHKLIRLMTISLGGEGYLTFIGNEFGHPEWIDFPREGNNWSYKYARRQWSLVDNKELKFEWLNEFDAAMIQLFKTKKILSAPPAQQWNMDIENSIMVFERANFIFVINHSPNNSIADYRFNIPSKRNYKVVLNTDESNFGGHDRLDKDTIYYGIEENDMAYLQIYIPNRTGLVFGLIE